MSDTNQNPEKYCCIVDPYTSADSICDALIAAGIHPIAIFTPKMQLTDAEKKAALTESKLKLSVHFTTVAETKKQLAGLNILAIIAGNERSCDIADHLSEAITPQIANPSKTSEYRANKFLMQEMISQTGLTPIQQVRVSKLPLSETDRAAIEAIKKPWFLKPGDQSGSYGVSICQSIAEIEKNLSQIIGKKRFNSEIKDGVIQEVISGDEYFVDTVSLNGQHAIVSVFKYTKEVFQYKPIYRSAELVSFYSQQGKLAIDYVKKVLDAVELKNGMAHTEVFLTDKGPYLVEVNPRISGLRGLANELSKQVYRTSQAELLVKSLLEPKQFLQETSHYPEMKDFGQLLCLQSWQDKIFTHFAEDKIKNLLSYRGHVLFKKYGDQLKIPAVLSDSVAIVTLVHHSEEQLLKDRETIFALEKQNGLFE